MNSKVKFSQFYILFDIRADDEEIDAVEAYYKVAGNIKKAISGHKLGENGFKANTTGAYFNALDSVNDSFKLLEDAINQA